MYVPGLLHGLEDKEERESRDANEQSDDDHLGHERLVKVVRDHGHESHQADGTECHHEQKPEPWDIATPTNDN